MAIASLFVFAHLQEGFAPAGRLTMTQGGRGVEASSFAYGLRYLQRPGSFELDPMGLALDDRAALRGVELRPLNNLPEFGGLRDAAPDAWGRRVIEASRRVPANSLPEATYLVEAGSDRVGALDVRPSLDDGGRAGTAPVQNLGYLMEAAERIEMGERVPAGLTELFGSGPGAGGARPKATVRDDAGLLCLAKFPSRADTFDVATAEYACLRLASLCGLSVPSVRVVDIAGTPVLLVRRFDRYWQHGQSAPRSEVVLHETLPGAGLTEQRLPFVSGLTLLACDEFESRLKGYVDLSHAVRRHVHPSRIRADNSELFARLVFNIFVSNDDDHLRNHGFLRDPRLQAWRLSPLYDVVPRPGVAHERFLHLEVGAQGKLATLDNAMTGHAAFIPDRPDAVAVVRRVWSQLRQWRAHFDSFGVSGRLIDTLGAGIRDLGNIASPALQAELRRPGREAATRGD
jgi:serine/threonine-protein kinase HipA